MDSFNTSNWSNTFSSNSMIQIKSQVNSGRTSSQYGNSVNYSYYGNEQIQNNGNAYFSRYK